jgi:long-chain acyl-CoA synthetase
MSQPTVFRAAPPSANFDTLPRLLRAQAARLRARPALREKEFGIWQPISWARYHERVREFALGLRALGFGRGDRLAIIGDNRPEWLYAELAAQSLGGVAVGIYQDSLADQVRYVLEHSEARVVVVEDQEQVDKLLDLEGRLPRLEHVVYDDPKGLARYRHPQLVGFSEVVARAAEVARRQPDLWDTEVDRGEPGDVALLCYTSGTTGSPKGAMLSHRNLIEMARSFAAAETLEPTDEYVSFLPLPWIGEQMMSVSSALVVGFTVNFPEEPETVQADIREIGPQVMFAPPRIWESLCSTVQVRIQDATRLKQWMYRWAMAVGARAAEQRFAGRPAPAGLRLANRLAWTFCFRALTDRLGLKRIRQAYTGGAALGPEIFRFFHAMGVNLKQAYGQTEIAGLSTAHRDGKIRFETVGEPFPNTEVRISDTGEILSRSPAVFLGYLKSPEATAETLREGWLHSGDAGILDTDGQLVVIDRMKDVLTLADGSKFSPQLMENKLKFSPYVREAVVVGKDRPCVTALLNVDYGNVGKWAETRAIAYTTYMDLAQKPEVLALLAEEVRRVNRDFPRVAKIRRFVSLYKELDADDDELTRTRKVRRGFIEERYRDIIEALYGPGLEELKVEADIRYEDGREAKVRTAVRLVTVEDAE